MSRSLHEIEKMSHEKWNRKKKKSVPVLWRCLPRFSKAKWRRTSRSVSHLPIRSSRIPPTEKEKQFFKWWINHERVRGVDQGKTEGSNGLPNKRRPQSHRPLSRVSMSTEEDTLQLCTTWGRSWAYGRPFQRKIKLPASSSEVLIENPSTGRGLHRRKLPAIRLLWLRHHWSRPSDEGGGHRWSSSRQCPCQFPTLWPFPASQRNGTESIKKTQKFHKSRFKTRSTRKKRKRFVAHCKSSH